GRHAVARARLELDQAEAALAAVAARVLVLGHGLRGHGIVERGRVLAAAARDIDGRALGAVVVDVPLRAVVGVALHGDVAGRLQDDRAAAATAAAARVVA